MVCPYILPFPVSVGFPLPVWALSVYPCLQQRQAHTQKILTEWIKASSGHPSSLQSFTGSIIPFLVQAPTFYTNLLIHWHNHTHVCLQDLEVLRQKPHVLVLNSRVLSQHKASIFDDWMTSPFFKGMTPAGHINVSPFKTIYETISDGYWRCLVWGIWSGTEDLTLSCSLKYAIQPCH